MLKGMAVSRGVARGTAYVLASESEFIAPKRSIADAEIGTELDRFEKAVEEAHRQIADLQKNVRTKIGQEAADIFNAHLLVLKDPVFLSQVTQLVSNRRINAEAALSEVIEQFSKAFTEISDAYLRERAADMRDIGRRILSVLIQAQGSETLQIPEGAIIVTEELLPSAAAHLELKNIRGFVTERGGKTSHACILARSLGTPAVTGVKEATAKIKTGDYLIVDGMAGTVFINPKRSVLHEYEKLEADFKAYRDSLKSLVDLPAKTRDGTKVTLLANIGKVADADAALLFKAEGVGLYRAEFAFNIWPQFPTEEEQYQLVKTVAEHFHPRPVVLRVLDLGADKNLPYFPLPRAANPLLAERGIRLMLKHRNILKTQLRAFLRVSAQHPVSILLPMVTSVEEAVLARQALEEAQASLRTAGHPFNPRTPMGAMIETPAAAMMAHRLAKVVDFFSLGTNDLVQYLLAADRDDPAMASYYEPLHPAVLQAIRSLVVAAGTEGKPLTLCGEMAGNPFYIELLLGLGLRTFSVAPGEILEVRSAVRSVELGEAESLAERALGLDTVKEIQHLLEGRSSLPGQPAVQP